MLLSMVAAVGVGRSIVADQSSWQGVSFGMFATYDNATSRTVRVTVHAADGARRARVPAELEDDAFRLKVVPRESAARRLASEILEREVDRGGDRGAERVVVELWRIHLDDEEGRLRLGTTRLARGEASR